MLNNPGAKFGLAPFLGVRSNDLDRSLPKAFSMERRWDPAMRKDLTLQQMLDGLLEFAEYFQRPDADFGEWELPQRQTPFAILSQRATDFLEACYELGWLESFNSARWANTEEATELWSDPEALEIATAHQISRILTVILREEHFSNVALMSAFESGYIQRVLRRIADLAAE